VVQITVGAGSDAIIVIESLPSNNILRVVLLTPSSLASLSLEASTDLNSSVIKVLVIKNQTPCLDLGCGPEKTTDNFLIEASIGFNKNISSPSFTSWNFFIAQLSLHFPRGYYLYPLIHF